MAQANPPPPPPILRVVPSEPLLKLVPSQGNINLAYRSIDIAKGTDAEAALERISTAAKGLVEHFGINNCSEEELKEEACLEALEDFADVVIGQLQWHANFTDLFGKASEQRSPTISIMPPLTRAGQTGREERDDDQAAATVGNGREEGWLTQVVRILQLANPALTAEEAIIQAMSLVNVGNQAPRGEAEKIPKDVTSSIAHIVMTRS
ncbi:uncharacterized protein UDID_17343 [Ustilago sp. UG-2017a]|nr:uncharacterized protein UDID_17343 [Ustilago sp. UG-2017a]